MVVGTRSLNYNELNEKHIAEAYDNINGWLSERKVAIRLKNKDYLQHCNTMLKIWDNTLVDLQSKNNIICPVRSTLWE